MDDPNLPGVTDTPTDSPSGTTTQDNGDPVNPRGAGTPSPEEAQWDNLTGNSQDRFRQVTRANNDLRRKLSDLEGQIQELNVNRNQLPSNPANRLDPTNPDVVVAVQNLDKVGVATKKYTEDVVNEKVMSLLYQFELDKLESRYDGDNGLPKFDRDEYQDYISRHPEYRNYTPEDVYNKMYEPEIFDWKVEHQGRPVSQTQSHSLRPSKTTVREETLTPETIEARLKEPDGRAWYEKNRERINAVIQKSSSE